MGYIPSTLSIQRVHIFLFNEIFMIESFFRINVVINYRI